MDIAEAATLIVGALVGYYVVAHYSRTRRMV
jgi:hypothetical protein